MTLLGEKIYIGTKALKAWPMTRGEYNTYRGWTLPDNENPEDLGYLVEYQDGGQPNHPDHEGYISWSPYDVFNNSYQAADELDFGKAWHVAFVMGKKVTRYGTPFLKKDDFLGYLNTVTEKDLTATDWKIVD